MDSELWTTESLCYLSFNMVQEFRISHQVSLVIIIAHSFLITCDVFECRFGFRGSNSSLRTRQWRVMRTLSK